MKQGAAKSSAKAMIRKKKQIHLKERYGNRDTKWKNKDNSY
jgi:hypothetical protein